MWKTGDKKEVWCHKLEIGVFQCSIQSNAPSLSPLHECLCLHISLWSRVSPEWTLFGQNLKTHIHVYTRLLFFNGEVVKKLWAELFLGLIAQLEKAATYPLVGSAVGLDKKLVVTVLIKSCYLSHAITRSNISNINILIPLYYLFRSADLILKTICELFLSNTCENISRLKHLYSSIIIAL